MPEPDMREFVEAVQELVLVALERLDQDGEQDDRRPTLYLRSEPERLTLMLWRGESTYHDPRGSYLGLSWYEYDENGCDTYPAVGWSGDYNIPIAGSPPFEWGVTVYSLKSWNVVSCVAEFRVQQPEMFRRATRAIRTGVKTTKEDWLTPYLKQIKRDFLHR